MSLPSFRQRTREPLPMNPKPLVIAHRGASSEVAEHTLPAYLEAIAAGADGVECDVRLTRDGHLVCVHDRTVDRTSNGTGPVSELDLTGLRALDFRSWKQPLPNSADDLLTDSPYLAGVEPDRLTEDGGQVLTLERLLGVVTDADRPVQLLIETKHPTRYSGLVEKELVRLLRRFGMAGAAASTAAARSADPPRAPIGRTAVSIMSFAPIALRRIRLLAPQVPLVLLQERVAAIRRDGSLPTGVGTAGPGIKVLRADTGYVARAHGAGNEVFCWTVDERGDVSLMRDLGVDAIITNRPAAVMAQLTSHRG